MKQIQNKYRGWETQKEVTTITLLLLITLTSHTSHPSPQFT